MRPITRTDAQRQPPPAFLSFHRPVLAAACPGGRPAGEHWVASTDRGRTRSSSRSCWKRTWTRLCRRPVLWAFGGPYVSDIISGLCGRGQEVALLFLLRAVSRPEEDPQGPGPSHCGQPGWAGRNGPEVGRLRLGAAPRGGARSRQSENRQLRSPVLAQVGWLGDRLRPRPGGPKRSWPSWPGGAGVRLCQRQSVFLDPILRLKECSRSAPIARRAAEAAEELARTASGNPAEL